MSALDGESGQVGVPWQVAFAHYIGQEWRAIYERNDRYITRVVREHSGRSTEQ